MGLARRLAGRLGSRLGRAGFEARVDAFFTRVVAAARQLVSSRWQTAGAWAWAAARLAFSVASLAACLPAVGVRVDLPVLVLAYAAGKVAGMLSLVPAGLGLVEGSLAGVLTAFGTPYEAALLVALLYRVAYHFVPTTVALVFFGPMLREAQRHA
jgi:hypothetical protein